MMLIEMLYLKGINNLSANTDGAISIVPKDKKDIFYQTVKEWEAITGFEMEYYIIKKYIRRDINNYIIIDDKSKIKKKGAFLSFKGILKGYAYPVVADALCEYFINGKDILDFLKETLNEPNGIYQFLKVQKMGDQFECYKQEVSRNIITLSKSGKPLKKHKIEDIVINETKIAKSVRWYVSNSGVKLIKRKWLDDKEEYSDAELQKGEFVTIFNDYADNPYDINFAFYVDLIQKEIDKIEQNG